MLKRPASFDEVGDPLRRTGHGEDAATMEIETRAVDVLPPRGFVGDELSVKRRLTEVAAINGHGGAVSFEKVIRMFTGLRVLQTKNLVRSQTQTMRTHINRPAKRVAEVEARCQLFFPNQSNVL